MSPDPDSIQGDRSAVEIVTVVFEVEQPLLHLQARSIARYLAPGAVTRVIVVDNSRPRMDRGTMSLLLREYGTWASRVVVITPEDLGAGSDTSGDRGQQALKLLVADHVEASRYVVFDAKNHLVGPLSLRQLESADGRMKIAFHSYRGHPREAGLRAVLSYFGLDPAFLDNFAASTTPFILHTHWARALLREIERRASEDFVRGFLATDMTEFPAYTAWLLSQGEDLTRHFAAQEQTRPVLWPHLANADGVRDMTNLAATDLPIFSVHREALARIDEVGAVALASFWASRGLFPDPRAAQEFIAAFKTHRRRKLMRQKLHRVPLTLRELASSRRSRTVHPEKTSV